MEELKCTLANWTGLAYKIPRIDLDRCKSRRFETKWRLFLFGKSGIQKRGIVYIGQAGARKMEKEYWID
ncbi:MAG: hypothetical protein ACLR43_14160 [Faecalibacillus faecis]